jgi:hypothetical protein
VPRARASAPVRSVPPPLARTCAEEGCTTRLSVYNDTAHCSLHCPAELLRTRGRHIA